MFDSIHNMTLKLFLNPFLAENFGFCHICDIKNVVS